SHHTQFIASLRAIQKGYTVEKTSERSIENQISIDTLNRLIKSVSISFAQDFRACEIDLDDIFDGYAEQKLLIKARQWEDDLEAYVLASCDEEIRRLKRLRDVERKTQMKIRMTDLNYLEDNIGTELYTFHNEYLSCAYDFLNSGDAILKEDSGCITPEIREQGLHPLEFLQSRYLSFVKEFVVENVKKRNLSLEETIAEFTKLRFNRIDYHIEVFNDRYIYAELYVMIRTGQLELAKNLVKEFKGFFDKYDPAFATSLLRYLNSKNKITNIKNTQSGSLDKFKIFIIRLMTHKDKASGDWIFSCIEDYLWFQFVICEENHVECNKPGNSKTGSHGDLISRFRGYPENIQLLVNILCGNFKNAAEILLRADFSICEIWFLMRKIIKFDKSSDSKALMADIVFIIAENFSSTANKYRIIATLRPILNETYYEIAANKIVDHRIFDIIGEDTKNPVCDLTMVHKIGEVLKERDNKKLIIKFHHLFSDDQFIVQVLCDYLAKNIINEEIGSKTNDSADSDDFWIIFKTVAAQYIEKDGDDNTRLLAALIAISEFKNKKDIKSLRETPFINKDTQYLLKRIPVVVETMIDQVCEVVRGTCDLAAAENVFNLCVELGLGEDVCRDVCSKVGILF
ncbi:Nucleoporin, partial [Dictyocoela roeselum]